MAYRDSCRAHTVYFRRGHIRSEEAVGWTPDGGGVTMQGVPIDHHRVYVLGTKQLQNGPAVVFLPVPGEVREERARTRVAVKKLDGRGEMMGRMADLRRTARVARPSRGRSAIPNRSHCGPSADRSGEVEYLGDYSRPGASVKQYEDEDGPPLVFEGNGRVQGGGMFLNLRPLSETN